MSQQNPITNSTESGHPVSQETSPPSSGEIALADGNNMTIIVHVQDNQEAPVVSIVLHDPLPPLVDLNPPRVLHITELTQYGGH